MNKTASEEKIAIVTGWVHEYGDALFSRASHLLGSREEAEDIVQETFLAALRSLDKFENRSSPKTWLTAILNNKVIDIFRKRTRFVELPFTHAEIEASAAVDSCFAEDEHWNRNTAGNIDLFEEHSIFKSEMFEALELCLHSLPARWRDIIHAKYLCSDAPKKIADMFGISDANYWQIVRRAKVALKKCIEQHY